MSLSSADKAFVDKREKRSKYWPAYGVFSLAILAAYSAWLWFESPELINPWRVIERLEARTLSETTMRVMAVMLPSVMATMLVFAFVVVLLWFIPFRNERRLIRIVRKLEAGASAKETHD